MQALNVLSRVAILALGLSSGLHAQGSLLRDLAPGGRPGDPGAPRIDFAFFFVNSEDFAGAVDEARIRVERLLDFEPYRSNQGLFNFWYLDVDIQATVPDPESWCYRTSCATEALPYHAELDGLAGPAFVLAYCFGFSCTATNGRVNGYYMPGFNSVHGEVHELGHFAADVIDEYGAGSGSPRLGANCAATYLEALALWGEHVGEGCGEDGVIDCLQSRGARGAHYNEVAFFTGDPRGCFDEEGHPYPHCYLSLNINLAYLATSKEDCLDSDEDCMYLEDGVCYSKRPGEAPEECPLDEGMGCGYSSRGFRSSLCSIMAYHFPGDSAETVPWLSYGVINQRLLCDRLVEDNLDVREGICATFLLPDGTDCDGNGVPDRAEVAVGLTPDCNENSVPDACDILSGLSPDANGNGVPDECDPVTTVTLGPVPDPITLESGARACSFTGALTPVCPSLPEDFVWRRAVFANVGSGDAAALVSQARLFLDENGNGAVDPGDEQIGPSTAFPPGIQRIAFEGLDTPLELNEPRSFLLLLLLLVGEPAAGAAGIFPWVWKPGPTWLLGTVLGLVALAFATSARRRRLLQIAVVAVALITGGLLATSGCGGGGGGGGGDPGPPVPRDLRIQLEELGVQGAASGAEAMISGLPLTAWSFDG